MMESKFKFQCKFQEWRLDSPSCLFMGYMCSFRGERVQYVTCNGFSVCDIQSALSVIQVPWGVCVMLMLSWKGFLQVVSTSVVSLVLCETGLVFLMLSFLFLSCFYLMNLDPLRYRIWFQNQLYLTSSGEMIAKFLGSLNQINNSLLKIKLYKLKFNKLY